MLMSYISPISLAANLVNSNDGFYLRGKSYGMETNLSTTREAWGVEASGDKG
jgi:hypothetical protein